MQLFYPNESSILDAEKLVDWKRINRAYNFEKLPENAIISVDYDVMPKFSWARCKKIKGIKGKIFSKGNVVFCSNFDNGGSGIIQLLEELRALGVRRFVFLGYAGMLNSTMHEAELYAINTAFFHNGVSSYYTDGQNAKPFDLQFYETVKSELNINNATCFSIDTPFRETPQLLSKLAQMGAQLIEMECAAIYSFCQFYQLPSICLLIGADKVDKVWTAPNNIHAIREILKNSIKTLSTLNFFK